IGCTAQKPAGTRGRGDEAVDVVERRERAVGGDRRDRRATPLACPGDSHADGGALSRAALAHDGDAVAQRELGHLLVAPHHHAAGGGDRPGDDAENVAGHGEREQPPLGSVEPCTEPLLGTEGGLDRDDQRDAAHAATAGEPSMPSAAHTVRASATAPSSPSITVSVTIARIPSASTAGTSARSR